MLIKNLNVKFEIKYVRESAILKVVWSKIELILNFVIVFKHVECENVIIRNKWSGALTREKIPYFYINMAANWPFLKWYGSKSNSS